MRRSRPARAARRELLARLGAAITDDGARSRLLRCRVRSVPVAGTWLTVRARHRRPVRVRCISDGGRYGFITSNGRLLGAGDLGAAAEAVAAGATAGIRDYARPGR